MVARNETTGGTRAETKKSFRQILSDEELDRLARRNLNGRQVCYVHQSYVAMS